MNPVVHGAAGSALRAALLRLPQPFGGYGARPARGPQRVKVLDRLRRRAMLRREHETLAADDAATLARIEPDFVDRLGAARDQAAIGDELLRLIFIACHPALPREAQVALTFRLLGGLETAELARDVLVPEAIVAQRIVRAKKAMLGQAFELPALDARAARPPGRGCRRWTPSRYPFLASAQADVLERLGRSIEASQA